MASRPPRIVIKQQPYHMPEAAEEEIDQILQDRIIEESVSPWSSPIIAVPKLDGGLKIYNDFWRLKQVTKFDCYPLPWVDDLVDRLGNACFISTLDLTKGYWQVDLTPLIHPKTVFFHPFRAMAVLGSPVWPPRGPSKIPAPV